jgi:hypothetical protein
LYWVSRVVLCVNEKDTEGEVPQGQKSKARALWHDTEKLNCDLWRVKRMTYKLIFCKVINNRILQSQKTSNWILCSSLSETIYSIKVGDCYQQKT